MRRLGQRAAAIVSLALVAALAGACTASPAGPASPASSAGPTLPPQAPSSEPVPTEPVAAGVPPTVTAAARVELAAIVGADAAASATVVSAAAVDWPDGSLGCPQPDMMYTQVITPGYQVVFEVDGKQYDMRVATSGGAMLCEAG